MTASRTKLIKIIGSSFALLILLGIVGYASFVMGVRADLRTPETIIIQGVSNIDEPPGVTADFEDFWNVWHTLKNSYRDSDSIKDRDLLYGAIRGMVDSVGDPYTVFFSPRDAQLFEEDIKGTFSGIGAEIGIKNNQLVVIAPLKDSPAETVGLRSGDVILMINGASTAGILVDDAVKQIRGPVGTEVTLTISREGLKKPQDITIIRETITIPVLEWRIEDKDILVIALYGFNEEAPSAFYKALKEATQDRRIKGLILDLRDNPGGYLEIAVEIANWFIERGDVIVMEDFGGGERNVFRAKREAPLHKVPTVVLVNEGSASASEIVAGALRDQLGIPLVGEKTFGKGSVQELRDFKDGSELKVTVARWVLPKGGTIEEEGLTPDYPVPLTDEDRKASRDPQFEKALEIIKAKIAEHESSTR